MYKCASQFAGMCQCADMPPIIVSVFRSLLECSLGYNHDSDRCVIDCSDALHLQSECNCLAMSK